MAIPACWRPSLILSRFYQLFALLSLHLFPLFFLPWLLLNCPGVRSCLPECLPQGTLLYLDERKFRPRQRGQDQRVAGLFSHLLRSHSFYSSPVALPRLFSGKAAHGLGSRCSSQMELLGSPAPGVRNSTLPVGLTPRL